LIERIKIENREQWLALRKPDVTASVVAALWGLHPYETLAGLWAEKTGIELGEADSSVLRRGRILEPAVAALVAEERPNWKITKSDVYLRDASLRLGATPDYYFEDETGKRGPLQCKSASPAAFEKYWQEGPPLWVALQNLTEAMLGDDEVAAIGLMVVDEYRCDPYIFPIERHRAAEQRIREAVEAFWDATDAGIQPELDPRRDSELIAALWPSEQEGKEVILPETVGQTLERYKEITKLIQGYEGEKTRLTNEVKILMQDAEIGLVSGRCGHWQVTLREQDRKAYDVRATSYRRLGIKRLEGPEDGDSST